MEKNTNNLFVNDGSFLERFKQLQQQQQQQQQEVPAAAATEQGNDEDGEQEDYTRKAPPEMSKSGFSVKKTNFVSSSVLHNKSSSQQTKAQSSSSNGKLAFSLKPKSRSVINPLKLGDDDDEDDENNEEKTENNSERFETDLHSRSKKLTTGSNHYSVKQKDSSMFITSFHPFYPICYSHTFGHYFSCINKSKKIQCIFCCSFPTI